MDIIVGVCKSNFGIGKAGTLPWHFKKDLQHFSKITRGNGSNAILMGRKTWDSLPRKPLPKRDNYIVSRNLKGENIFSSLEEFVEFSKTKNYDKIFIIGGSSLYTECLEKGLVENIYITYIHRDYDCDTFFPKIPKSFLLKSNNIDEENNVLLEFCVYSNQIKGCL